MESIKLILHYSSIIYLKAKQSLFKVGQEDPFIYFILFGRMKLYRDDDSRLGEVLNIGWTVGEEILFDKEAKSRQEKCIGIEETCLVGIERKHFISCKKIL